MPPGPTYCTYGGRVPASGVGYVPGTVAPQAGSSLDAAMPTAEPFFRVELPSGEHLLHRMASNSRKHPLQFGREVVANILGKPELKDWKRCLPKSTAERQGTEEQLEALMTNEFKAAFAPFDPMR